MKIQTAVLESELHNIKRLIRLQGSQLIMGVWGVGHQRVDAWIELAITFGLLSENRVRASPKFRISTRTYTYLT